MRVLRFTLLPVLALLPVTAEAQPVWDATGISGFFAGRRPVGDGRGYQEDWLQAAQGGVVLGRLPFAAPETRVRGHRDHRGDSVSI